MSYVGLHDVKLSLRQTHDEDDELLNRLIASAEAECKQFIGAALPAEKLPDLAQGIILMVQADYDGDPLQRESLRRAAESLWMPHATLSRLSV